MIIYDFEMMFLYIAIYPALLRILYFKKLHTVWSKGFQSKFW